MKLDVKLGTQDTESTVQSKKMRLSENSQTFVFQMFTKNVYSNPIGSIVREITSNAQDSHSEAGINAPVLIKYFEDKNTDTHYISFIDYGVGMSPDRVENIYGVYFESTKRVDNVQIGGFGIGGKTPLAYRRSTGLGESEYDNSFYVITRYNGVEYTYMIHEGDDSPLISKLHEEETDKRNGTEIRVPVLKSDLHKFASEIKRQLYYFENLVFEGFETISRDVSNDYQIVKGKNFLFRGSGYDNNIHLCLGRVAYPIDYSALGLSSYSYQLPIAIKLDIGEINPTASRESIDYSESTIELLKNKLDIVLNEIKELIMKDYTNVRTLEDYYNVKEDFGYYTFANGQRIHVRDIIDFSSLKFDKFKYKDYKIPSFKNLFDVFFTVKNYGDKGSRYYYTGFNGSYDKLKSTTNTFYAGTVFNRKVIKQGYLKDLHSRFHIVTFRNPFNDNNLVYEITRLFNCKESDLYNYGDATKDSGYREKTLSDFGEKVLEIGENLEKIIEKYLKKYDDIVVSDEFLAERKKSREKKSFSKQSLVVSAIGESYFSTKTRIEFSKLDNFKGRIFYCTYDEEYLMRSYLRMFKKLFPKAGIYDVSSYYGINFREYWNNDDANKDAKFLFVRVSKANLKYMVALENANPIKDIVQILFRRKADELETFLKYNDLFKKYRLIDSSYRADYMQEINKMFSNKIKLIDKKMETYKNIKFSCHFETINDLDSLKTMLGVDNVQHNDKDIDKLIKRIDGAVNIIRKNNIIFEDLRFELSDLRYTHRYEQRINMLKKLMVFE
jgi:hypothetical protein